MPFFAPAFGMPKAPITNIIFGTMTVVAGDDHTCKSSTTAPRRFSGSSLHRTFATL
jgi:hypothetical protein